MEDKHKVLIVDDDPVCVGVVEYHLQSAGYLTKSAFDGEQAWKLLSKRMHEYSAIILDRIMLGMDGMALLEKLKTSPVLSKIPVIMQTTHAQPGEFVNAVSAGVFDFIYKPVDRTLLLFMVHNAIKSTAGRSSSSSPLAGSIGHAAAAA